MTIPTKPPLPKAPTMRPFAPTGINGEMTLARHFYHDFRALPHRCVMIAYKDGNKLGYINHVWDYMPDAARLARQTEWFSWTNECYSILEAQFGKGACEQAKSQHTELEDPDPYDPFKCMVRGMMGDHLPTEVRKVGQRAFDYEGQSYVCSITTSVKHGILRNVEFAWNRLPPYVPATLESEKAWACKCKAEIEAKYGVGSIVRAGTTGTVTEKAGYTPVSLDANTRVRIWVILGLHTYKPIRQTN